MFSKYKVYLNFIKKKQSLLFLILILLSIVIPALYLLGDSRDSNKEKVYDLYRDYQKSFRDIEDILSENILKSDKGNILFVDVRKKKEMSVSIIPGAITREIFLANKEKYKDKTIVAYCTIGYRSGLFAQEMKKKGIIVFNLSAGILGWIHEGGTVTNSERVVKKVHVYGDKWDLVPEGYETVTFVFFENLFNSFR